ncbi:MAG: hypothetical protein WCJ52_00325 [Phenylobacterium sp.]|jgi:hypothetical protein|uniref:hypothetical protein n=1 Tax=Phenylobacterium sp. TaxID=1871053 RepID=UPI00301A02FD
MRGLLALLGLVLLAGCAAPKAELDADRMGRLFIDAVQRGDWQAIDRGIAPQLMASPDHAAGIEKVRQAFPTDPPWSIRLLASRQTGGKGDPGPEQAKLQYLYQFAERRAVVDLIVVPVGWRRVIPATAQTPRKESALLAKPPEAPASGSGGYEVVRVYRALTMSYTEVTKTDEAAQAFWAPGRTAGQWLFLGLAAATPAFMLWTGVRVLRVPVLEGRLFWALACLAGLGTLWMDWTSGTTGFLPYSLRLMGFGLEKGPSPLSPWMVSLTLPIGALAASVRLALQRLRR